MATADSAAKITPAEDVGGKRQAILDAASRVFLAEGYGPASMDVIATEAGVSKQTVYSHFGAKEALFAAIVDEKCGALVAPVLLPPEPGRDAEKVLSELARRFIEAILAPGNMALFRVVVAESGRFPELARAFYESGPRAAVEDLARYLAEISAQGALAIDDAKASAHLFFAMLRGDLYVRRLLDLTDAPDVRAIEPLVRQAVAAFLAAHAPR